MHRSCGQAQRRIARFCDAAVVGVSLRMQGLLRQQVAFQAETTTADGGGGFRCSLTTPPVDAVVSGWHVVVPTLVLADSRTGLFPLVRFIRVSTCVPQHAAVVPLKSFALPIALPNSNSVACPHSCLHSTAQGRRHAGVEKCAPDLHITQLTRTCADQHSGRS